MQNSKVSAIDGINGRDRQPEAPNQEVLAGLVERVTFHNADNRVCVLRIKAQSHRDLVTLVGHAAMVSAVEWITGMHPPKAAGYPVCF